jgi:rhamnosyltransferase
MLRFPFRLPRTYGVGKAFEILYDSYFVMKSRFVLKSDIVYCLGVSSGLALCVLRPFKILSAVNVDGLEWTREKFGIVEKVFLRASFLACCAASTRIVLDNRALMPHIPEKFRWKTVHITYGVSGTSCQFQSEREPQIQLPKGNRVFDGAYWLVVARLEPENNIHLIIRGYLSSASTRPLVIVGSCSSSRYERVLKDIVGKTGGGKTVIMAGSIYDRRLLTWLRCGCRAYIHGHSVGGTNPSLLEAMSVGNVVIAHDNVFNRDVCIEAALYFTDELSLARSIDAVDENPSAFGGLAEEAKRRADEHHRWEDVVSAHEKLFSDMMSL